MLKRCVDIVVSVVALAVTSPIALAVAIAIRVEDRGPVFYRHQRVGRGGTDIEVLKFRSMRLNNDGPSVTTAGEDRITAVGRILRRFKLDEIPQFVNVLRGDMSIVGPRPEVRSFVDLYPDEYERLLQHRPGITDPASIKFSNEEQVLAQQSNPQRYYEQVLLPSKLALSLDYVENQSLAVDVKLVAQTAAAIFGRSR